MGTIASVSQTFADIDRTLVDTLQAELQKNDVLAADMVREQLEAGQDGFGQPLTPSYLDDPYFNYAKHPQVAARNYMQWKERITPPQTTWRLMLPARDPATPNLRINGYYHETISAKPIPRGLKITSSGDAAGIGDAVTAKYGDERLYTLGEQAKTYLAENVFKPLLNKIFGK